MAEQKEEDPAEKANVLAGNRSVLHLYPDHARALGAFAADWALVELLLKLMMAKLLQITYDRADVVYREFPAFSAKTKLMRRLIHMFVDDEDVYKGALKLVGDAQRLSDRRNTYAHAVYSGNGPPDKLYIIHGTPPSDATQWRKNSEVLELSTIAADTQSAASLVERLYEFGPDLVAHVTTELKQ